MGGGQPESVVRIDTVRRPRPFDFAHAVWCLAEIGEQGGDVSEQARRARLPREAYG